MTKRYIFLTVLAFLFLTISCNKEADNRKKVPDVIDPSEQPNELNNALVIYGTKQNGPMPASVNPSAVNITVSVPSALITNNNFLFLPFAFRSQSKLAGVYLQVQGAKEYWDVPLSAIDPNYNSTAIAIGVPEFILEGKFNIIYQLYDINKNISEPKSINVEIASSQLSCGTNQGIPRVEGKDGITIKTFNMGEKAGKVIVSYYMYTQKDRMDIRYNGKWIKSTSSKLLEEGQAPPFRTCDEAMPSEGFVSDGGSFEIDYDPAQGREINIYVSGCLEGGTLWYFDVTCPENSESPDNICDNGTARDVYDKSDKNYHHYPAEGDELTTVICDPLTDPNCTKGAVFKAMLAQSNFIAPTKDTNPVKDCKVTLADIIFFKNPVITKINAGEYSITNYTIINWKAPNGVVYSHKLHPGKVTRTIKELNGKIVVQTEGEGTGMLPSINQSSWVSSAVWEEDVDADLLKYWNSKK